MKKRLRLALLVCATLVVDGTAVSSSDLAVREAPSIKKPTPLILLVTGDGVAVGGVALTAQ